MAAEERSTDFAYHNIELYKSVSLGSGAYGGVCKATCDGLLCAAKIMHPTLFDPLDPGRDSYLGKFVRECHLLSLARHPNVVQYLGTYTDPDTRLPVLLMELCDESLTAFLERSPGPLSYHIQVNICHDIALALVYLHSNGLIHRDLTGNNVLMVAGPRAKITDFGMSKLASVNPRMSALTMCPGNVLYMPPEALDEAKTYTAKLDIFSFGVLVIQVLTMHFPKPMDRFRAVQMKQSKEEDEEKEIREVVPETERRQAHLMLIPDTHSLKPVILLCLKKKESLRPSAVQLSEGLSQLKTSSDYADSNQKLQVNSKIELLQKQLKAMTIEAEVNRTRSTELESLIDYKNDELQAKENELLTFKNATETQKQQLERKIQAYEHSLQAKDVTLSELQRVVEEQQCEPEANSTELQVLELAFDTKENELQTMRNQLREFQDTVDAHEKSLQARDTKLQELQLAFEAQRQQLEVKCRQLQQCQREIEMHERNIQAKDIQLQEMNFTIEAKAKHMEAKDIQFQEQQFAMLQDRQLQAEAQGISRLVASKDEELHKKQRELQEAQEQLQASEQLLSEFQQSLEEKDKTIIDLRKTISDKNELIQASQEQLAIEQQVTAKVKPVANEANWIKGINAPEEMSRGAAVVYENRVCFMPVGSHKVYAYHHKSKQWSRLPDNPNADCGLVVVNGLLTSVGGCAFGCTSTLLSLIGDSTWSEVFPPMPTARSQVACVTVRRTLVVAGGDQDQNKVGSGLDTVEAMDTHTKQWISISPLPRKCSALSAAVIGDNIYLAGGYCSGNSVFTCSISDIEQKPKRTRMRLTLTRSQWKELTKLPVSFSTLAMLGGDLLAICGKDHSENPSATVYSFDIREKVWKVFSHMENSRLFCLAVTLPEKDTLMVVGGSDSAVTLTSVEFMKI